MLNWVENAIVWNYEDELNTENEIKFLNETLCINKCEIYDSITFLFQWFWVIIVQYWEKDNSIQLWHTYLNT